MKRLFLFISIITLASIATAYSYRQDKKITITLSTQEWDIVLQGLNELPMKTSSSVYSSIMQQAQYQLQQRPKVDSTIKKKP